ncbi:MAG TPA: hypothetical protein PK020_06445 [Ilumatobacteraceae bacterium]|nr:hypothetical protein [Ilumatobacteraceae bacterium]HRB02369.1 hypothetical protein [Ilumatobacteraceae bacterium]
MIVRWLIIAVVLVALSWIVMIDAWPAERRILERLAPATATSLLHDKDI